ncbi:feruloyl-CoA synthase [Rhizobium sp. L1K21]|uniref:feruloyl-CoA synthase n=1 Tax=Rhizobium sp. L1K21 TaxID=2954933 RepID=UPI002093C022|nr:feruloyl-CoA synthase [Rhizobium sp. L1K21]MCO6185364.1 feruloyl-CoA synthase [Rhizobium sp. L1K21]
MPVVNMPGIRPVNMGDLSVTLDKGKDGVMYIRPKDQLSEVPVSMIAKLEEWAEKTPDRLFIADRLPNGEWRKVTYGEARKYARSVAQFIIDQGLSVDRPVAILSGNSVNHALVALGSMMAGVPHAPIAPAYSTKSKDFDKLHHVFDLITPGLVFAEHIELYEDAIKAVVLESVPVFGTGDLSTVHEAHDLSEIMTREATTDVDFALSEVGPDTIAKFLFTSGSTGKPKAVINTQRMLCANQVMIRDTLAFLKDEPPVLVDWLPWNHTAGGNHNVGITIFNGGTLYVDDGSPTPIGIHKTVHNLLDIAPTLYFNVPKGYEMLVEHLRQNKTLRERFYSRLNVLQYAGASLADHVFQALEEMSEQTIGKKVMIITGYGSTETGPFLATTTWPVGRPGEIGLPVPGSEMKLVPNGEKLEVRVKGASITPGYWRQSDKTKEAFDEEGYYLMQDALKFHDPEDPSKGLLFDGRVTEDFKLNTGTWVNMAGVRAATIRGLAPLVRDMVLTGLDLPHIGALLFLDYDACRTEFPELAGEEDPGVIARHPALVERIQSGINALARQATGSSTLVSRVIILETPPSPDASEITDKGSINQRAVMANRKQECDDLYADTIPAHVLVADKKGK